MKLENCKTCRSKHFLKFICSICGYSVSGMIVPHDSHTKERYKYCPLCGHKYDYTLVDEYLFHKNMAKEVADETGTKNGEV